MIFETIITTQAGDGRIHIAPMGIREDNGLVVLAPFRPSSTLDNVLGNGYAVVNYCDDVRIFAGCLTGRRDWPTVPADKVPCVRLKSALAHCELKLERIEEDELRPRLLCRVVHRVSHLPFCGFNRAQAAVIEGAILISRRELLPLQKIEREMAYLRIAIDKTAGPIEQEAWGWLQARLQTFRREAGGPRS